MTVVLSCFSTGRAAASEFPLVPGARWIASARSMDEVDRVLVPLLAQAGRRAPIVAPVTLSKEREEAWALPVLDRARWVEAGLDPTQGWSVFADGEGTWVSASVVDAAKVAAWLDRWARLRGLLHREVVPAGKGVDVVRWARARGSRVVAGRVVTSSRVVVLAQSDVRSVDLVASAKRVENVVPASAPVEGVLRGWLRRASARDVWWSVRPQSDGLDVDVRFSGVVPGWVDVDPARASWVTAGLAGRGAAFRGRALVGPEWAWYAADSLAEGWSRSSASWVSALQALATGPVELVGEQVFPGRAVTRNGTVEWARVFPAWFVLPERDEGRVAAFASLEREPVRTGWTGRVEAAGRTARLVVGDVSLPSPPAGAVATPFGDGCARGHPVVAGTVDGPLLAKALDGVSLLGALRDEGVLAAWALGSELGPLLRVSEPLTVIACAEEGRTVDARLRWRFGGKNGKTR